jgi:1,4-dihydroxy-2-naphthoate octaprenyltransferase
MELLAEQTTGDLFIMLLMGLVVVGILIYLNNDDQHWW